MCNACDNYLIHFLIMNLIFMKRLDDEIIVFES